MSIKIVIDRNDAREGHVIQLQGPPPGLAHEIAHAASCNGEVVSVVVQDESGFLTQYCKGIIISGGYHEVPPAEDKPAY